jgi:hypothetical protein
MLQNIWSGEFPLDCSYKTCHFYLSNILSNLGMKNGTRIHMCILYMQKIYLKILEVQKYGFLASTINRVLLDLGAAVYFRYLFILLRVYNNRQSI